MIKRPKNTDSEQDLLKMQMEFMKEKEKNKNFQPAASVVKMQKIGMLISLSVISKIVFISIYLQKRNNLSFPSDVD